MRKGVLRNFTKLTGKHLCQSLFFNKVANRPPKWQILTVVLENWGKLAANHLIEKPALLNFVNLSKLFCTRL